MHLHSVTNYLYSRSRLIGRRLKYNCYLRNWMERRRNSLLLQEARDKADCSSINNSPLISVVIPTYNRGKLLTERTIPSVLKQTYQNFEIIVVGDHCADNTGELIANIDDKRIRFLNLEQRGNYPLNPNDRWMVAGSVPSNKGVELCLGEWIAPLDDDDEFTENHLQVLLQYALENDYEMVYGIVEMEIEPGKWYKIGSYPFQCGNISRISALYNAKLKFFEIDINAWHFSEPGDWNLWRRMKEAGVRIGFINEVVGKHYLEHTQKGV
ncbi:MAG: glycosyltransferase family 2 protein [Atribacterota bacterium]|nr:glycosyltransferase family 2 protein [Atribacterota bacterium]